MLLRALRFAYITWFDIWGIDEIYVLIILHQKPIKLLLNFTKNK